MTDRVELTEPSWPAYQMPTPEQWVPWFLEQSREGQVQMAREIFKAKDQAYRCFMGNHEARIDWNHRQANRYRLAWLSARRRGKHPETRSILTAEKLKTMPLGATTWARVGDLNLNLTEARVVAFGRDSRGIIIRARVGVWKVLDVEGEWPNQKLQLLLLRREG